MTPTHKIFPLLLSGLLLLFMLSGAVMPALASNPTPPANTISPLQPAQGLQVDGPPSIPMNVRGIVTLNDVEAPAGTLVTAWIDGKQCGQAFAVQTINGHSWYVLDVPADSQVAGCGVPGKIITFHIGAALAKPTLAWSTTPNLSFPISGPYYNFYLPVVRH